jgi:hypothetical protein
VNFLTVAGKRGLLLREVLGCKASTERNRDEYIMDIGLLWKS